MSESNFRKPEQLAAIQRLLAVIKDKSAFYREKFAGLDLASIRTWEDFERLPLSEKADLRNAYPLGLQAVPDEDVIRIHSSSGTTGTPVIIPYTAQDVEDWAKMFARCYDMAGCTKRDRIQITPGYGLWTAGIGFQAGVERLGAMAIPTGPGNTDKQIQMLTDLKSTVLCATSSYALLLAEEVEKRGIRDKIRLKKGIIGSERWGAKMRRRIAQELGIQLYDIYGLTEIYGPGIAISCDQDCGMHYWDDYLYFEVIDQHTGAHVPPGEVGELVITTLRKEGAPLIRYRTHDLTRFMPGDCACGSPYPRIDAILGRTDDMVKIKGVIVFPALFDEVLHKIEGVSSEYNVVIEHMDGRDVVTVSFEAAEGADFDAVEAAVRRRCKERIGLTIVPKAVPLGGLPRSEKKTKRLFDKR